MNNIFSRATLLLLLMSMLFLTACSSSSKDEPIIITTPFTPVGLVAEGDDQSVILSWDEALGAESYIVFISDSGTEDGYTALASVASNSYTVANLVNDKPYWFKVSAINSYGESSLSAYAETTPQTPTAPPAAPTNIQLVAKDGAISLSWTRAQFAKYYNVYVSLSPDGGFLPIKSVTETHADISGLINGIKYYFKIEGVNSFRAGNISKVVSASPSEPLMSPSAPTGLTAMSGLSKIFLYWNESADAQSYSVYMSTSANGSYSPVATVTKPLFLSTDLLKNTKYYFKIAAINSAGQSSFSSVISAATEEPTSKPSAPSPISAIPGNTLVQLSWGVSKGAEYYNVYISADNSATYTLATVTTEPHYTIGNLNNGKTYFFSIAAVNSLGEGTRSMGVRATPLAPIVRPPSPAALFAAPENSQVALNWATTPCTEAYTVYQSASADGVYIPIATIKGTSYTVSSLINSTPYYFRVTARNRTGESLYSNTASATPIAPIAAPSVPVSFTATPSDGTVLLTWEPSFTADTYSVYYSEIAPQSFIKSLFGARVSFVKIASKTATNHTVSNLQNDKTYYFYVTASNIAGESVTSVIASATPKAAQTAPTTPVGLAAASGNSQVTLSWNQSPDTVSYIIYISSSETGTYSATATVSGTAYNAANLTNGTTYWFKIAAVNAAGQSGFSNAAAATPASPISAPTAPLSLSAMASDKSASVTWDVSRLADFYNIYMSTSADGDFNLVATRALNSFSISNLTNSQTYYFRVTAIDSAGESTPSVTVAVTPQQPLMPPAVPLALNALPANSSVSLNWQSSANAESYTVYFSDSQSGTYSPVATVTGTSYIVSNITNSTSYWFKVSAGNNAGASAQSAPVAATPQRPISVPQAPTGVSATPSNAAAIISWSSQQLADSYNIYMSSELNGTYTKVTSQFGTSFTIPDLTNGQTYYFYVKAQNIAGESIAGVTLTVVPQTPIDIPSAPFGLTAGAGDSEVTLSWESSPNADSYTLYIALAENGTYYGLTTVHSLTYTVVSLLNDRAYWFKVSASNASGTSSFSNAVSAIPKIPVFVPARPTGLSATAYDSRAVLNWDNSTDSSSYNVYYAIETSETFNLLGNALTPTYTASSLTNGQTYKFYVRGVNTAGESEISSIVTSAPQEPVFALHPQIYAATAGDSQFTVTWQPVANASGYVLYASLVENGNYLPITTTSDTAYTALRVSNDTIYWLKLASVNTHGTGEQTAAFSVTPAKTITIPAAPQGLEIAIGDSKADLAWNPSAGATSYNVYYKTSPNGDFTLLTNRINTSYTNLSLTNSTTYYFAVTALNSAGESVYSQTVSGTPQAPIYPPAPPYSVNINPGDGYAEIGWSASSGATYYTIYYSDSGASSGFYSLGTVEGTGVRIVALPNGNPIWVKITASNTAGESAYSNVVTTTPNVPILPPAAPAALNAVSIDSGAILKWDNVTGAIAYNVYQSSAANGTYTKLFGTDGLTAAITPLNNTQTYYFKVSAVNSAGEGALSASASATPIANIYPPAAPLGLSAVAENGAVTLSWQSSPNALKYIVYEYSAPSTYYPLAILTSTSFKVTGLINDNNYAFVVTALNSVSESAHSSVVTAIPRAPGAIPQAPSSISAMAGNTSATITWGAVVNADSYTLYQSTSQNGTYNVVATGLTAISYNVTGLTNSTTYWYKVTASNIAGEGTYSGAVSVQPIAPIVPPSAPVILTLNSGDGNANLTWTKDSTATKYNVYVSDSQNGTYTLITTSTNPNAKVSGLTVGQTYWFKVSALKGALEGAESTAQSVKITNSAAPDEPDDFYASSRVGAVYLDWERVSKATSYNVYMSTSKNGEYTLKTNVPTSEATISLAAGSYWFKVSSVNNAGEGPRTSAIMGTAK